MSIVNVPKSDVVVQLAKELKKMNEFKAPLWAKFVKTGCHAERPPVNPDWWFVRVASMMNKLNDLGPVGVSKLRTKYGGKRNRGMAPERFKKGSGKIIRLMLQQLEKAGFAKQTAKGVHKGRVLTPKGVAFFEKVSYQIMKEQNVVFPRKSPVPVQKEILPQTVDAVQPAEQKAEVPKPKKPRAPRKKKEEAPVAEPQNG